MLVAGPTGFPGFPAVLGDINSPAFRLMWKIAAPSGEIEPLRVRRVHRQPARSVHTGGQNDSCPMFCAIGGAIESAIVVVTEAPVNAAAGDDQVQGSLGVQRHAIGEQFFAGDSGVLEGPSLAAVG